MPGVGELGIFIVLEGPEGAGKSTQVVRLAAELEREGRAHLITREPGGTPAGDAIRGVLLDPRLRVDALPELLLYCASRAQHVDEVIRPALARGEVVISDRFTAASVAYQGYGRGIDLDFVNTLNERVSGGTHPDLTVLLDIDPLLGLQRVGTRGAQDRLEQAGLPFHQRVREGFLAQSQGNPDWLVIDGNSDADAIAAKIWGRVAAVLASGPHA